MASSKTLIETLKYYLNPADGRFEDLKRGNFRVNIIKDLTAGLIVAMVAIPLAMGFAMASGLRPEQGIVGGAVAGLLGALFGGSKYQVYGPTAAFIPVIGGLMATYDHGFLVLASLLAGVLLMVFGLLRLGKIVEKVPHSIVVGFTIGIAIVIAFSQLGEILGFTHKLGYGIVEQVRHSVEYIHEANIFAVAVALGTFLLCRVLLKVSSFIPGPLIALAFGYLAAATFWSDKGLVLIKDKYGSIPTDLGVFTPPHIPFEFTDKVLFDLTYYVLAIFIVAAIESLLCSRMADRMANNTGKPFDANKELWGQGMVNIFTPLFNGFPHTGALARTAVNIRLGAVSPLAGIAKFGFKLLLAVFLASQLEQVPMACIGGVLLYVAAGMVKVKEIKEVWKTREHLHMGLLIYTAAMVPLFGFMTAVLTAIGIYIAYLAAMSARRPAAVLEGIRVTEAIPVKKKVDVHGFADPDNLHLTLLQRNVEWSTRMHRENPELFTELAKHQKPFALWIGCSDSRVPPNIITGTVPGDLFIHRNIANMVVHTDLNLLSVVDYGVNALGIDHIIVCGHYGCGGVQAAMGPEFDGLAANWVRHIRDVARIHEDELPRTSKGQERFDKLVELNVAEQVFALSRTMVLRDAWARGRKVRVHGWVYSLDNGMIKDLRVTRDHHALEAGTVTA
ncbi:MAG: SulP family inorganic anion transporter [Flavobacteriales bacterium]